MIFSLLTAALSNRPWGADPANDWLNVMVLAGNAASTGMVGILPRARAGHQCRLKLQMPQRAPHRLSDKTRPLAWRHRGTQRTCDICRQAY